MFRLGIILLIMCSSVAAQNIHYSARYTTILNQPDVLRKSGLKNAHCIFKDSRQLIWIGTENGLFLYDGTNVTYIRHREGDPFSLPNNNIVTLDEDEQGNIWVGTMGGVAKLNPFNLKSKVYRRILNNFYGDYDNKVLVDNDGKIWAGNSDGLELFDSLKNQFRIVWKDRPGANFLSSYITSICNYKGDSLILGTFVDFVILNRKNLKFRRINYLNNDVLVTHLYYDPLRKNLWAGTWGHGIVLLDSLNHFHSWTWQRPTTEYTTNIVSGVLQTNMENEENLWVNIGAGLIRVPYSKAACIPDFTKAVLYMNEKPELQNNAAALQDKEGFIWVGGTYGLAHFVQHESTFRLIPYRLKGFVQDMQELNINNQKTIAITTWHANNGLTLFDEQMHFIKSPDLFQKKKSKSNVSGLVMDSKKRFWIPTLGGLFVTDDHFNLVFDFKSLENTSDQLTTEKVSGVFISNDTVWIFYYKRGIDLYNLNFHKIKSLSDSDGLKEQLFWRAYKDRNNNLWICGNSFFYKYVPQTGKFKYYDFSGENTAYSPIDIAESKDGTLWIATEIGLIHFNPFNETHIHISSPLLEKEDNILSVSVDCKGDVWFITKNHLVHYQTGSRQFSLYDEDDGLDKFQMQWLRTFDGKTFLLSQSEKLYEFNPEQWQTYNKPPIVFIHSVQVNDSSLNYDKQLTRLDLPFNKNKIYIEFDGVNYIKPEQNQYAYKLDGVDKEWTYSGKNFASYANLSPGNYQFHVKASNYAGIWSKEYLMVIYLKSPYWETWWFITLMVFALGTLFYLVIRYVSQRNLRERILVLEKEQAVEKERNRIASDMHDDLGSGLTKIAILSEVAKAQIDQKETAVGQLQKISSSSRELIDNLQDIIWVLNPKNDSLESLSAYIREYTLKFLDGTSIDAYFDYPGYLPSIKLSEEQRRNIFLVIKESLNNIVKHASCTTVRITITVVAGELRISIEDNGAGFDKKVIRDFANGLINMENRMKQINAGYKIRSAPRQGTSTFLEIPI